MERVKAVFTFDFLKGYFLSDGTTDDSGNRVAANSPSERLGQELKDDVKTFVESPAGQLAIAVVTSGKGRFSGRYVDGAAAYRTNVPRNAQGIPEPLREATGPHSRLQFDKVNPTRIYSATEFDATGQPIMRIDFSGRTGQNIPHSHVYLPEKGAFSKDKTPLRK